MVYYNPMKALDNISEKAFGENTSHGIGIHKR